MKTPYTSLYLSRILARLYPAERVDGATSLLPLLRKAAFDDFVGRLQVTPREHAALSSACEDAATLGYLRFAVADATSGTPACDADGVDRDLHMHLVAASEMALSALADGDLRPCSALYLVDSADDYEITVSRRVCWTSLGRSVEGRFEASFDRNGRIMTARRYALNALNGADGGNDWADHDLLARVAAWCDEVRPAQRQAA